MIGLFVFELMGENLTKCFFSLFEKGMRKSQDFKKIVLETEKEFGRAKGRRKIRDVLHKKKKRERNKNK